MVGGSICTGKMWADRDVLFVDDEGLFKPQQHFFRVAGNPQPATWRVVLESPSGRGVREVR